MSYRSQHGVHEFVRLLGPHQATHFKDTQGQTGDDSGVFRQCLLQYLAIFLIVVEGANFWNAAKTLKGTEVLLVDMGEMGVRNDDIG